MIKTKQNTIKKNKVTNSTLLNKFNSIIKGLSIEKVKSYEDLKEIKVSIDTFNVKVSNLFLSNFDNYYRLGTFYNSLRCYMKDNQREHYKNSNWGDFVKSHKVQIHSESIIRKFIKLSSYTLDELKNVIKENDLSSYEKLYSFMTKKDKEKQQKQIKEVSKVEEDNKEKYISLHTIDTRKYNNFNNVNFSMILKMNKNTKINNWFHSSSGSLVSAKVLQRRNEQLKDYFLGLGIDFNIKIKTK